MPDGAALSDRMVVEETNGESDLLTTNTAMKG